MLDLRPATIDDADLLLAWRNEPATVALSSSPYPIPRDEHLAWLRGKLTDPRCELFIAFAGELAVGMVRFDGDTISIAVAPEQRGRGFAKELINASRLYHLGPIIALIRAINAASLRAFRACGFKWRRNLGGDMQEFVS
jgi:RimJ/RimL family protein N-acetyltransferase